MGNLLHHARGAKHKAFRILRAIRCCLEPAAAALETLCGDDRAHLVRGMLAHRVLSAQGRTFAELKAAPKLDSKYGHLGVAFGATALVIALFAAAAVGDEDDARQGCSAFLVLLRSALTALDNWRFCGPVSHDAQQSLAAERRALERAIAGCVRGAALADANGVHAEGQAARRLELMVAAARRAAWPAGELVDETSHPILMQRIAAGEMVDVDSHHVSRPPLRSSSGAQPLARPLVVPLSALPAMDGSAPRWHDDGSSSSGSSWNFSTSSASSMVSDCDDYGDYADPGEFGAVAQSFVVASVADQASLMRATALEAVARA